MAMRSSPFGKHCLQRRQRARPVGAASMRYVDARAENGIEHRQRGTPVRRAPATQQPDSATPDDDAAAAPQGGGDGGGKRRRAPSAAQASGPTAPSRRSARARAAPVYTDAMDSNSDDADADFDEGEAGVDDE